MTALLQDEELYLTPEEYLAREEESLEKHEYINGYVQGMAGATWDHRIIAGNIFALLTLQLRGRPCVPQSSDARLRIKLPGRAFYYYPDVVVDCTGSRELEVTEPTLVAEVLSPTTRRADRGDKLLNYLNLPSMRVYLLVEQTQVHVTVHRRAQDGSWMTEILTELDATLALPEIGSVLPLREVYDRVVSPAP